MGDGDAEMPAWVIEARRFIATGRQEFLARAIDACGDASVGEFLGCRELPERLQVPDEAFQPLAESLESAGRQAEAAAVRLLGWRAVAIAADSPERLTPEIQKFTQQACNHATSLSRDAGFVECEAAFVRALGTRALKLHEWQDAAKLLDHSVEENRGK